MKRQGMWLVRGAVLVVLTGSFMGCQYEQLKEENDALWSQNKELQDELTRSRLALDASERERQSLLNQQPVNVMPTTAAANTGFGEIQGIEAIQGPDRITVSVPGDVLFAPGQAGLRTAAQKTLDQIAAVIKRDYPTNTIFVKGFTDTDPIRKSKWRDNLELSLHRSATVFRHLEKQGIEPTRMQAVGQGQWHPRESKAKSRRVEIIVALQ